MRRSGAPSQLSVSRGLKRKSLAGEENESDTENDKSKTNLGNRKCKRISLKENKLE